MADPTCDSDGWDQGKCIRCGDMDTRTVPALGHDWNGTTCRNCGAVRENPFTDVPEGSFYYDPVIWAVANGVTTGATATTFNPGGECMRAHVVTFLWRAAGQPEPATTVNPFVDVAPTDFYYKAVLWAVENGVTNGVDATHFGATKACNRAQVVTFLYRAMGNPEITTTDCPFTDVQAGQWYVSPILWAVENGITNGMSADTFGVDTTCNRAQVVTFLYRAMGNPAVSTTTCPFTDVQAGQWYEKPILWAVENGITNGMSATSFGVNSICNRAQVVTFLYRTFA